MGHRRVAQLVALTLIVLSAIHIQPVSRVWRCKCMSGSIRGSPDQDVGTACPSSPAHQVKRAACCCAVGCGACPHSWSSPALALPQAQAAEESWGQYIKFQAGRLASAVKKSYISGEWCWAPPGGAVSQGDVSGSTQAFGDSHHTHIPAPAPHFVYFSVDDEVVPVVTNLPGHVGDTQYVRIQ